jgi:hypothetical protein
MSAFCIECGAQLEGAAPKFCAGCGFPVGAMNNEQIHESEKSPVDPARSDNYEPDVEVKEEYYPTNLDDWTSTHLEVYRNHRKMIVDSMDFLDNVSVERHWIAARHELTKLFTNLPDIGYCTLLGDGGAIPDARTWTRKQLKKGIPSDSLPHPDKKCPQRAVVRWCHVKYVMDGSSSKLKPAEIVSFVDTCRGHHAAFQVPATPSLGRGPILEVGGWETVDFTLF